MINDNEVTEIMNDFSINSRIHAAKDSQRQRIIESLMNSGNLEFTDSKIHVIKDSRSQRFKESLH